MLFYLFTTMTKAVGKHVLRVFESRSCVLMCAIGCLGKVHFGGDDVSLYGTPKEEPGPTPMSAVDSGKQSFLKNQLQALFQPTDNKLAMKLFGSKKALMKERIRQKAAGHWVIHPCSSFR